MPQGFSGRVKVEWLDDGRDMQLLEELVYTDKNGRKWIALRGAIVNGASIPKVLWSLLGSPFVGKYRRASVIHDVYCDMHLRPAQEVHDVFLEMLLWDGVEEGVARMMYHAVNSFGPRW